MCVCVCVCHSREGVLNSLAVVKEFECGVGSFLVADLKSWKLLGLFPLYKCCTDAHTTLEFEIVNRITIHAMYPTGDTLETHVYMVCLF